MLAAQHYAIMCRLMAAAGPISSDFQFMTGKTRIALSTRVQVPSGALYNQAAQHFTAHLVSVDGLKGQNPEL